MMLGEELQPRFDLVPGLGGEELFGIGTVGEGSFLEAVKGFPHGYFLSVFQGGSSPLKTASTRSEEHTSELQSLRHLVCRLLLEKKKKNQYLLSHSSYDRHTSVWPAGPAEP